MKLQRVKLEWSGLSSMYPEKKAKRKGLKERKMYEVMEEYMFGISNIA